MSYPLLSIEDFGAALHAAGDLDPVYEALVAPGVVDDDPARRDRWLLAYWVFYHVGVASYLADAPSVPAFWRTLEVALLNNDPSPVGGRWPRGRERRHMRGENAMRCGMELEHRYKDDPSGFFRYVVPTAGPKEEGTLGWMAQGVMGRVRKHVGFGPWIAFKVADMLERVVGVPISFEHAEVFLFDQPKEAALLLWSQKVAKSALPDPRLRPRDETAALKQVTDYLIGHFARLGDAPPARAPRARAYGLQEVETVLCKWKSHLNGHYPVGLDRRELREAAIEWAGVSPTAARFAEALK